MWSFAVEINSVDSFDLNLRMNDASHFVLVCCPIIHVSEWFCVILLMEDSTYLYFGRCTGVRIRDFSVASFENVFIISLL